MPGRTLSICERVEAALPDLLTGERVEPGIHDHLASCAACRAARNRLAAQLEGLRDGLAALAPSPFLEDAALDAARETPSGAGPSFARRVAIPLAAAATILLALWVLLPPGEGPAPVGPAGEGEAAGEPAKAPPVWIPPAPGTIETARRQNVVDPGLRLLDATTQAPKKLHLAWNEAGEQVATWADGFLPPQDGVVHRWVCADDDALSGDQVLSLRAGIHEPRMVLGTGVLNAVGGTVTASDDALTIEKGGRRWTTTPGTMEGEITVSSPDGGTSARVRVVVTSGYAGTLLLDGPIGRALALYQFEIPGRVVFDTGDGLPVTMGEYRVMARRARARIRIPEIGFDRVLEVQVLASDDAPPWSGDWPGGRPSATFSGEEPAGITAARRIRFDDDGNVVSSSPTAIRLRQTDGSRTRIDLGPFRGGPVQLWLEFGRGDVPRVPDVPIVGPLFPPTTVVPISMDAQPLDLRVVATELQGRFPPGADVRIARVWRGRTAIPSREGVVLTKVAADGRLRFPRLVGESGATLRMLVTPKDGEAVFHEVVVESSLLPAPRFPMMLTADGTLKLPGWEGRIDESAGLEALVEALARRVGHPGVRDRQGLARIVLDLKVEEGTPWQLVQWLLQAAAHPDVRIHRFRIAPALSSGVPIEHALPRDEGTSGPTAGDGTPCLEVTLVRRDPDASLTVRIQNAATGAESTWRPQETEIDLAAALETIRGTSEPGCAVVKAPRPSAVRFEDVWPVLDALRSLDIEDVRFEGAPPPR